MGETNGNLALWRSLEKSDTRFVKKITGKAYGGDSPSPQWIKRRLTETFGPAGVGWGVNVLGERVIDCDDKTKLHSLHIRLWYVHNDKRGEVEAFGGTPICYMTTGGNGKPPRFVYDEDAAKKSMTDALVKAASDMGMCADIFMGQWNDSKYVAQLRQEELAAERAAVQQEEKAEVEAGQRDHGAWKEMEWPAATKSGGWEDLRDPEVWVERHMKWVSSLQSSTDIRGTAADRIQRIRGLSAKHQGVFEMLKDRGFESTVEEVETVYASAVKQLEGGE